MYGFQVYAMFLPVVPWAVLAVIVFIYAYRYRKEKING